MPPGIVWWQECWHSPESLMSLLSAAPHTGVQVSSSASLWLVRHWQCSLLIGCLCDNPLSRCWWPNPSTSGVWLLHNCQLCTLLLHGLLLVRMSKFWPLIGQPWPDRHVFAPGSPLIPSRNHPQRPRDSGAPMRSSNDRYWPITGLAGERRGIKHEKSSCVQMSLH